MCVATMALAIGCFAAAILGMEGQQRMMIPVYYEFMMIFEYRVSIVRVETSLSLVVPHNGLTSHSQFLQLPLHFLDFLLRKNT
jgi:hypothetical protein